MTFLPCFHLKLIEQRKLKETSLAPFSGVKCVWRQGWSEQYDLHCSWWVLPLHQAPSCVYIQSSQDCFEEVHIIFISYVRKWSSGKLNNLCEHMWWVNGEDEIAELGSRDSSLFLWMWNRFLPQPERRGHREKTKFGRLIKLIIGESLASYRLWNLVLNPKVV